MIIKPSEIQSINWEGLSITDFTSDQDTQSSFAKIEVPPGNSHKISWSKISEKYYYILSGQLHFMMKHKEYLLTGGDLCIVPLKTKFAYINKTNVPVEILLIHTPKFNIGNEVFEEEYSKEK